MDLLQYFKQYIKSISGQKSSFLLAVSGGMDSMALLHLFRAAGLDVSIAHCNFGLRREDSVNDESFILHYAAEAGIRIYIKRFETEQHAATHNISIQMAARELRYQWFMELQAEHAFDFIATAHHADDNAETMLLNLIRGKSLSAVAGIPSLKIIRPLLDVSKKEIEEYCTENKLEWREDRSNSTDDYDRNFLRHNIIPLLRKLNPSLEKTMRYSSVLLQEAEWLLNQEFIKWKKEYVSDDGQVVKVNGIEKLWKHELKHNLLYRLLREYNFPAAVISNLTSQPILQPGRQFSSPTHTLTFDRDTLYVAANDDKQDSSVSIPETGIYQLGNASLSISRSSLPETVNDGTNVFYADADKLRFPIEARHWKEGDYFFPSGMKGKKKLSDFFIDNKIPHVEKKRVWLLVCGQEVAWVAGLRADERFKATPASKNIIKITFAGQ